MITGIDISASQDFVLPDDKENPTVWKLGLVPSLVFMRLTQEAKDNEIEGCYKVLQISLRGWENFEGVAFKTEKTKMFGRELDMVPIDVIEQIPSKYVMELAVKAMELNSVSDDEQKN